MRRTRSLPLTLTVLALLPAPGGAAGDARKLFREKVRPILTSKCLSCHGGDGKKRGGLDLTRRKALLKGGDSGPALAPGESGRSLLYEKLAGREMPPQNPLSEEQVAAFKRWIDAGAPYDEEPLTLVVKRAGPDWWSLQPVKRPPPPPMVGAGLPRPYPRFDGNAIDAFIRAKLNEKGLKLAPEADRLTLIRRATFDLTGLPPTPEEIDAFLNDDSPDAYGRLIDRLLASPHYGERWARHWLDVVRFAESHGYETNQLRPNAWPYRDYVIRAFNEDVPYPRFILEQLAGDTLAGADVLTQSATGFLVGGAHDVVGNQTVEGQLQQRADDLDDMINATAATFLGLTVNCARCHDHKFDPITQKDYYALQAVFAGVQHAERDLRPPSPSAAPAEIARLRAELARVERALDGFEPAARPDATGPKRPAVHPRRNVERFAPVEARFVRFTVRATNDGIQPCIDELEIYTAEKTPRNVALAGAGAKATASSEFPNAAIHKIIHVNDGRHGNGRSWISNEAGKGWVQVELPKAVRIARIVWGRDREEKFRDRLAVDYVIEAAVEPGKWKPVASSVDRRPYNARGTPEPPALTPEQQSRHTALQARREKVRQRIPEYAPVRKVYAGTFQQPGPTHLLPRGDPLRKGAEVAPAAPAVVRPSLSLPADAPESQRRVALARWLGSPDNPLTARVMVNRVWHYHFGTGIVATPSDFGYNGDRPSHPELLDWLASEYVRGGWRLKPLHRLIMTSAAYRQSGRINDRAMSLDRQNRLLWRMPPRRLEAEAIRDSVLAVSGELVRRRGGPGYNVWEKNTNYVVVFKPKAELGPDEFRRMVYQFKPRSRQDPTFGVFDCPDAALARPRRTTSTTVLQALNLLNSRFTIRQAEFFAERLKREAGDDAARQVERACRLAFGRPPTAKETEAARTVIRRHGLRTFCRALYNANEFLYVD